MSEKVNPSALKPTTLAEAENFLIPFIKVDVVTLEVKEALPSVPKPNSEYPGGLKLEPKKPRVG